MGEKPSKIKPGTSPLRKSQDIPSENLKFLVILENVKCKNLTQSEVFVEFNFNNQRTIVTSIQLGQMNPKWDLRESFELITSTQGLMTSFLKISLKSETKGTLSEIQLNLYDVATGPVLNDMTLENRSMKINGRLSFSLRMLQKIRMCLVPESIRFEFFEPRRENTYFFSLKMRTCEGDETMSEISPVLVRGCQTTRGEEDFDPNLIKEQLPGNVGDFPLMRAKAAPAKTFSSGKDLRWEFKISKSMNTCVSEAKKGGFPYLEAEFLTSDMGSNCLSVNLFSPQKPVSSSELGIEHREKMIGECSISLVKLFKEDIYHYDMNHSEQGLAFVQVRPKKENREKFWRKGNQVGFLEAHFQFRSTCFVRQHIIGVRTENGIQKESSFFMRSESETSKKLSVPKEVREFLTLKENLVDAFFQLYDPHNISAKSQLQRADLRLEVDRNLSKLKESLHTSMKKEHTSSFLFNNYKELMSTQTAIIELLETLLNYVEEIDEKLQTSTYECMRLILNRGELDLACMGFDQKYIENFDPKLPAETLLKTPGLRKEDVAYLRSKLKLAGRYLEVFVKALKYVLVKFPQCAKKEQEFFDKICVMAYFRLPEFRKKFYDCITRKEDNIEEWRASEWGIDEKINEEMREKSLISLFSWEKDFNQVLRSSKEGQQHYEALGQLLAMEAWQKRFSERNEVFFRFLAEWNKHVHQKVTIKEHYISWEDLPGYRILLKAFLMELKNREIAKYPVSLKQAAANFLLHEKLLNIFIVIVYNKTKVYDGMTTYTTFDMINQWLKSLTLMNKKFPSFFDFGFFFEGVRRVLDQDHVYSIGKCVLMIYNNFQLFPAEQQKNICEHLLGKVFFKLFMHWSKAVRNFFHHLLLYRIFHLHRTIKTSLTKTSDIKRELSLYNTRREKLKTDKKCLINDFINMKYSKMMTILENCRTDLENEEFFASPKNKHHTLKERLREMKRLKAPKKDITLFSSPISKMKYKESPKGSCIFINSDAFRKNPNATQSMSMSIDFTLENPPEGGSVSQFELMMEEESLSKASKDSFLDSDDEKKKENESPLIENPPKSKEMKKFASSMMEKDFSAHLKNMKQQKETTNSVILSKKMVYYNEEEKEYYQIPPEYLKYLLTSFSEFDNVNKNYLEWYKLIYYKLSKEGKKMDPSHSVYYLTEVPKLEIEWINDKEEDKKIGV